MKRLLLLLVWIFVFAILAKAQNQQLIDSLLVELQHSQRDTLRLKILFTLTWENLKSRTELSTAREFADSAMSLSLELDSDRGVATVNYYYGVIGRLEGNYSEALQHFAKCNDFYIEIGDSTRLANSLYHVAVIHSYKGDYQKSIETYLQILRIYEANNDAYMMATTLNSIGALHEKLNNFDLSEKMGHQALQIFDSLNSEIDMADCYHNLGNMYAAKKDFSSAVGYYNNAIKINEKLENRWGTAYSLESLGNVQRERGNYDEALFNHLASLEIREGLGQKKEIALSLVAVGTDYSKLGNQDRAIEYFNRALEVSNEIGSKPELRDSYRMLAETYADQRAYRQAYEYHQKYVMVKDSLLNEEMTRQINELQTQYETEKKEREIQLLSQQQQIQRAELTQQTTLKKAFIVGFLLLAILIFVLIWNYRQKLKTREMIAKKNEEINRQKILELEKNQKLLALDAMISGQEVERKRIAQDLHDGLGALLSTVQMQFSRIEGEIRKLHEMDVFNKANSMLDEACKEVRKIAHNMMPGTLLKLGLVPALKDICHNINDSHDFNIDFQSFNMDDRLNEVTEVTIYRIVQEALNNIIKHAKANEVIVQLAREDGTINITIEDDGVGFNVSEAMEKNGMGMRSLDSRVKYLNGELNIRSEIGKGTAIEIEIPA